MKKLHNDFDNRIDVNLKNGEYWTSSFSEISKRVNSNIGKGNEWLFYSMPLDVIVYIYCLQSGTSGFNGHGHFIGRLTWERNAYVIPIIAY